MTRFVSLASVLLLTFAMTGCCCLHRGGGACGPCGGGTPYGAYYGGTSGCATGNCGVNAPGTYVDPNAGVFGPTGSNVQLGAPTATAPVYYGGYPVTAQAPTNPLPTF